MTGAQIKAVASVLKRKFSNLTVEETIDLATAVIEALQQATPNISPLSTHTPTPTDDYDDDLPF